MPNKSPCTIMPRLTGSSYNSVATNWKVTSVGDAELQPKGFHTDQMQSSMVLFSMVHITLVMRNQRTHLTPVRSVYLHTKSTGTNGFVFLSNNGGSGVLLNQQIVFTSLRRFNHNSSHPNFLEARTLHTINRSKNQQENKKNNSSRHLFEWGITPLLQFFSDID